MRRLDTLLSKISYLWRLVIYSRVYIAVGSVLVVYSVSVLLGSSFSSLLGTVVFATVFAAYAMDRYFDIEEDEINLEFGSWRLAQGLFYTGLISLATAFISALLIGIEMFLFILGLVLLLVLYSTEILPSSLRYQRLKDVPFVKNIIISLNLALLWIFTPFIYK